MIMQLEAGTLWRKLLETTEAAIDCEALHSIDTEATQLQQDGLSFVVRVATNLVRKAQDKQKQAATRPANGGEFNPFLPPEPELTVAEISDTHLAVLNKFNVVERHLLIVTREFVHQETLLTQADFEALWFCLAEYPALGFYNGGAAAGASQKHKHLQLAPLPLYPGQDAYPFETLYASAPGDGIQHLQSLPFKHAWSNLPLGTSKHDTSEAAALSLQLYREMLKQVGIQALANDEGERQSAPYNLLMTDSWMLLAPRSQEFSQGISVNALGYVGSLFVKDQTGLETIRRFGPMNLLREVSLSTSEALNI
ncbi:MAG: phosphorylase [Pseudomonadota bacterium]